MTSDQPCSKRSRGHVEPSSMTVNQLIELLTTHCNGDEIVQADGCDCIEDAYGISKWPSSTRHPTGEVGVMRKENYPEIKPEVTT